MGIFSKLFKKQPESEKKTTTAQKSASSDQGNKNLMLSQYAAFYAYQGSEAHRKRYIVKLLRLGFNENEAEKLLNFETDILKRFNKNYLLHPNFTQMWFFGLSQPFFLKYPKEKGDILKEHFLTLSELCKIVDEAEWHFWNSHEREMPDEVWSEIYTWRLNGPGGEFAVKYFTMVAEVTGIPTEKIAAYSSNEGKHLSDYKWR
ncbi:MAG: hypothetical protein IJG49_07145 [Erysipelotrichaceae bacterium]|nr:hypothetical protein [Erysipelotrichaceae bacterium]